MHGSIRPRNACEEVVRATGAFKGPEIGCPRAHPPSKADAPGPLPSAAPKVVYIHVSDGAAQEVALVDGGRDGQASATIEAKRTG